MTAPHGIGVGLRREFVDQLVHTTRAVDFIEIVPENWYKPRNRAALALYRERWPIVPHSIHLSIGGPDPLDEQYLAAMRDMCRYVDAPFFSDHVCYSSIGGVYVQDLLPLPFSAEAIEHTVARIRAVAPSFDVPLVLENPTYYSVMPGSTMDEVTFLTTLLDQADCGMLLDVNNVYVNGKNHGFDPYAFIDRMPFERVHQIHVAGHAHHDRIDCIIDTHGAPVIDDVWALYRHTIQRAGRLIPTVVEWDSKIPPLDEVLDQVDRARTEAVAALG